MFYKPHDVTANVPNTIFIPHITEHEITTVISSMKHSSPGWDSQFQKILKILLTHTMTMFTFCKIGIFPTD